jgi:hypothetical protein
MIRCLEVRVELEVMTPWLLQARGMIPSDLVVRRETTVEVADSRVVVVLAEEALADLVDGRQIRLVGSAIVISCKAAWDMEFTSNCEVEPRYEFMKTRRNHDHVSIGKCNAARNMRSNLRKEEVLIIIWYIST